MARKLTSTIGVCAGRFIRYVARQVSYVNTVAFCAALLSAYIANALVIELSGLVVPDLRPMALAQSRSSERLSERARRRAQQALERARERARKQAEKARERARERARRQAETAARARQRARQRATEQAEKRRERATERARSQAEKRRERARDREEDDRDHEVEQPAEKEPAHAADDQGDGGRRKDARTLQELEDDSPPATVVEMLKRWTQPKPKPKPARKSDRKRKRKRARRRRADIRLDLPPSANSTFKRDELLASDLTNRSLDLARRLGFRVKTVGRFSTLNATVSKLIPPPGLGARAARRLLRRKLPKNRVSLNRYYRIYRIARGNTQPGAKAPLRQQLPWRTRCSGDQCYALSLIAWRRSLGECTRSVKIGVIDTPVDHRHQTFSGKDIHVGTFVAAARKTSADWHGTGILALLTGDPNTTTPGLIPRASFYVADVFSQDAAGNPVAESLSLLKAFEWMDAFGVNIINLSLAGPKDPLIERTIDRLSKKGIIFVAAAGNNGPTAPPNYPAAYKQVVAVTAVNKKLRNYRYANRGAFIDIAAPGVRIWTAAPGQNEGYRSGTSFAVPFVTAVAAAHYRRLANPSKDSLLAAIATRDLGPRGRDQIYGRGLILAPSSCDGRPPIRIAPAVFARQNR